MILLYSGLPASGKTTRALVWVAEDHEHRRRINYDDIRIELYGCKGPIYFKGKDIGGREKAIKFLALERATDFFKKNPIQNSIVVDNTNLTPAARQPWIELGRNLGIEVVQEEIDTPVAECIRRDALREGDSQVGRDVIERMALSSGWACNHDHNRICPDDETCCLETEKEVSR